MSKLRALLLPFLMPVLPVLAPAAVAITLSGCTVEARPAYYRPPPPCPGGRWIEGHYGPYGHWHPGHWRCPGEVEVIEVR